MRGDRKLDRFKRGSLGAAWIVGVGSGQQGVGGEMEAKIINRFLNPVPFTTSPPFTGISYTLSHSVLPSSCKVGMFVFTSQMRKLRLRERGV